MNSISIVSKKTINSDIMSDNDFDIDDIKELEEFCEKNSILSINLGNMNPKQALIILKNNINTNKDKRIILHG